MSSITDVGTGQYTINFSTAMPDTNYAPLGFTKWGGGPYLVGWTGYSTAGLSVATGVGSGAPADIEAISFAFFR